MSVKLIMQWDIRPGQDQEYFEFVVRELMPATQRLGLRVIAAWFTVYAADEQPHIMAEALADDLKTMRGILATDTWKQVYGRLLDYVENYTQKVVHTTGDFQL